MSEVRSIRPAAPALPATVEDLLNQRRIAQRIRTLNDEVDELHLRMWDDENYRKYFTPIWREETIEGSFIADELTAAGIMRTYARENRFPITSRANLTAIAHSLRVVCRRYRISRKERQRSVSGETVDIGDDNGTE